MNYIRYAFSQYFNWLGKFATILGIVAIVSIEKCLAVGIVIACAVLAFLIPFLIAICKHNFKLHTIGKSKISFKFGNLFDEDCFVITTNRYFDVNPTGEYIARDSILGEFVAKYYPNNVSELESKIQEELSKIKGKKTENKFGYGTYIKIKQNEKLVYFLAFTDREKEKQPDDFFERTMQTFLKGINRENHGKIIAIPLIGNNNNLSNSGFSDSVMTIESMMAMINSFEIANQKSELKLKIVALPEKRAELINYVRFHSK